jgi:programmed cell death 6-interacting protein
MGVKQANIVLESLITFTEIDCCNSLLFLQTERMVRDEKESDDQLREQFKERWTRTPSDKLTETFCGNMAKYRDIINNAMQADKLIRDKFETHRRGMDLLTKGPDDLITFVPSGGPGGSNVKNSSAVHKLRRLMEEVSFSSH